MHAQPVRGIFASTSFTRYFIGQAFSYVGDGLRTIALPLLVFHLTHSALSTGGAFIAEVLPFTLLAVVGGSLADRVDRRRLMITCDAVRCVVMLVLAVLFMTHHLTVPMIYAALAIIASTAAFFLGGQSSSIPYLLGRNLTTRAMSALVAAESTSNLVVPAIGAAIFAVFGPLPALFANAGTYFASQVAIAGVPTLGPETPGKLPSWRELIADIRLGFRTLFGDASMRAQAFVAMGLNALGYSCFAILIPFLKRDFGASDQMVGIFFSMLAIGAVCGAILAGRVDRRWPFGKMLTIAYAIDAIIFLPVLIAPNIWVCAAFWSLTSVLTNFEVSQILGWRMRVIPEELIGRTMGAVRLTVLIALPPSVVIAGWIADHVSPWAAMCACGLGYMIIAGAAIATPAIRSEAR